jgi:hypothetical protein
MVEGMFLGEFEKLLDLNLTIIEYLKKQLRIDTPLILQSDLGIVAKGNELLIEICREVQASAYLAQAATRKYLDADLFADAGIELNFFAPPSPVYPQLWGDFIYDLSAFDLLFNCGPKSHEIVCGAPDHPR